MSEVRYICTLKVWDNHTLFSFSPVWGQKERYCWLIMLIIWPYFHRICIRIISLVSRPYDSCYDSRFHRQRKPDIYWFLEIKNSLSVSLPLVISSPCIPSYHFWSRLRLTRSGPVSEINPVSWIPPSGLDLIGLDCCLCSVPQLFICLCLLNLLDLLRYWFQVLILINVLISGDSVWCKRVRITNRWSDRTVIPRFAARLKWSGPQTALCEDGHCVFEHSDTPTWGLHFAWCSWYPTLCLGQDQDQDQDHPCRHLVQFNPSTAVFLVRSMVR